jgi:RNA polymerase sigma-70 factor (ECF subfamily)
MDEEAFRLFYSRTAPRLRAYLARTAPDPSFADDLLQETYFRWLRARLPPGMEYEHRKNYLFRIATNLMRDQARRPPTATLEDQPSETRLADSVIERQDMRRVMEELRPRERELVWLAYVEQMSHDEIAAVVGAKAASIRPMLHRARHKLAELLRARGFKPGREK